MSSDWSIAVFPLFVPQSPANFIEPLSQAEMNETVCCRCKLIQLAELAQCQTLEPSFFRETEITTDNEPKTTCNFNEKSALPA